MRFKLIEGQLARWLEELSQYDMEIVHRAGKYHSNADGLSRITDEISPCDCYRAGASLTSLPCGGCRYCTRAHQQWSRFEEDVDDVVPLSLRSISGGPDNIYWGPAYSSKQLRESQLEDQDIAAVISWKQDKKEPTQSELSLSSPTVKFFWLNKERLDLLEGVLYYKWDTPAGVCKHLFVVPTQMRDEILVACHDAKLSGHLGQKKTYERLRASFFWHGMSRDCHSYVRTCAICSVNKKPTIRPKAALGSYHAGFPMERVHIDIVGPLQTSSRGNKYILMMIDQFTKWVEIVPLSTQTAEVVARAVVEGFFARMGCPLQLHTDQGRNFESALFKELCERLEIAKTRTTPYRPCSNGQVERYNRTLLQMIRCYISEHPDTWDAYLPYLASAINSTVHSNTGFTPNMMMLGREVLQPIELMTGVAESTQSSTDPASYVEGLVEILPRIHDLARRNLQSSQMRQKRDYDLRLKARRYQVGDLVYKIDSSTKVGQSAKLRPIWRGPLLVVEVLSSILYRVKDRKRESVIHHDRLKLCEDRDIPLWLRRMRNKVLHKEVADPSNLPDSDGDLGLDKLFDSVELQTDKSSPAQVTDSASQGVSGACPSQVIGNVTSNILADIGDNPTNGVTIQTRRGRNIRQPGYLRDYDSN